MPPGAPTRGLRAKKRVSVRANGAAIAPFIDRLISRLFPVCDRRLLRLPQMHTVRIAGSCKSVLAVSILTHSSDLPLTFASLLLQTTVV